VRGAQLIITDSTISGKRTANIAVTDGLIVRAGKLQVARVQLS